MSNENANKAVVGRWFDKFWGKTCDLSIVDEIAAPDMLLKYSLHEPRRGHADIKAFMTDFRKAFPDLYFWGTADLIAEDDYVVGQWEGGGTHTGPAFGDFIQVFSRVLPWGISIRVETSGSERKQKCGKLWSI
jgi:SnoaL-like polyketide cyclase